MKFFKKKENEEAIKILTSFVEGKIDVYGFWDIFNSNTDLKKIIYDDKKNPVKNHPFLYDINLKYLYHRCEVYRVVKNYFIRRRMNLNFYNKEDFLYSQLLAIVPDYVDMDTQWFYTNILDSCHFDIGSKQWKKYIKECIKENFIFKDKPPIWLHNPEWPISNNKPLIFIKQDKHPDDLDLEKINYVFSDGSNDIVIEQFD